MHQDVRLNRLIFNPRRTLWLEFYSNIGLLTDKPARKYAQSPQITLQTYQQEKRQQTAFKDPDEADAHSEASEAALPSFRRRLQ